MINLRRHEYRNGVVKAKKSIPKTLRIIIDDVACLPTIMKILDVNGLLWRSVIEKRESKSEAYVNMIRRIHKNYQIIITDNIAVCYKLCLDCGRANVCTPINYESVNASEFINTYK